MTQKDEHSHNVRITGGQKTINQNGWEKKKMKLGEGKYLKCERFKSLFFKQCAILIFIAVSTVSVTGDMLEAVAGQE